MDQTKEQIKNILSDSYVRLSIVVAALVMLIFIALQEGFSVWVMTKLGLEEKVAESEQLVSGRGEPDFWTIGNELGAYRRSQSNAEHMSHPPTGYGGKLIGQMYRY